MNKRDEALEEYTETLDRISREFIKAKQEARAILNAKLAVIRAELHSELKVVRTVQQGEGE